MVKNLPKNYSLDVAFSSATQALQSGQSVFSMGFGFSEVNQDGSWRGDGQAAKKVDAGSNFYFTAFDTACCSAQKVEWIEIHFHSENTPFENVENPIIVGSSQIASQHGHSAGCNVLGVYSLIGPYIVSTVEVKSETFRCTVRVLTKNGVLYSVDPEIIVEGPNVPGESSKQQKRSPSRGKPAK
ncbi:MAG TPA: hypothetical protein VKC61_21295 [Pyrinomonadaceae bacterium]|nr:hypothetical protein [Pyrinomonadaceae bacterium]